VLGPNLYLIYAAMPRQYRLHSAQVYKRVREAGCADPHVWQAAFLHDSGKYDPATHRSVTILHRVAIVLLKATSPGKALLERLAARRGPAGVLGYVLYPFFLSKHHARLGALLARKHGASHEVVRLIAEHHKHAQADLPLSALQAADEQS
jgi:putative nucleotidyltransferase with HDIG domain